LLGPRRPGSIEIESNPCPADKTQGSARASVPPESSSHATTDAISEVDRLQARLGEGPCLDAVHHPPPNGVVLADDLEGDDVERWPRFAPLAVMAGFRSMLSLSLTATRDGRRAALNLYADHPDAFDAAAITTGGLFAGHAGALLYGAEHVEYLNVALESRDVIGQAKGVLMERFGIDRNEAFDMLVKSSQDTNLKLTAVAAWLVDETEQKHAGDR
jgi:hypothetical protein